MREFFIVIDRDDDREWVYKPTQFSVLLEAMAAMHPVQKWTFEYEDCRITIYPIVFYHMPEGEEKEEIELRALKVLNLFP